MGLTKYSRKKLVLNKYTKKCGFQQIYEKDVVLNKWTAQVERPIESQPRKDLRRQRYGPDPGLIPDNPF